MGVNPTRFTAVDGWAEHSDGPASMKPGQIATFLSHRKLWQEILDQNIQIAWVMEDDHRCDNEILFLEERIEELNDVDPGWDLCYMIRSKDEDQFYRDHCYNWWSKPFEKEKHPIEIRRLSTHVISPKPIMGTGCYLISNRGARFLVRACKQIYAPIDVQIPRMRSYMRVYAFDPNMAYVGEEWIRDSNASNGVN